MSTNYHTAHATDGALSATELNSRLSGLDTGITSARLTAGTETIASGIVTVSPTGNYNLIIAAESGTSDNLDEITGIGVGDIVLLRANAGDTITVIHQNGVTNDFYNVTGGNIDLSEDNPLVYVLTESGKLMQIQTSVSRSIAILRDEKSTGTDGGTALVTTWNPRDLNTETYDPDGLVTIASNEFVPIAGTYEIFAQAGAGATTQKHRLRLYNVTGAAVVDYGLSMATSTATESGLATINTIFTANGTDSYRIDHWTKVGRVTDGLGSANDDGSNEIYLQIRLEKIS